MPSKKVKFKNNLGYELSASLELPMQVVPSAFAIFAHVFTGNKSLSAVRHISRSLTLNGIAVLRFDFTGLGQSEGDFAETNFSSNVDDIIAASDYLTSQYDAPSILIGHSLGGAASIMAASKLDNIKAVATIGAPSYPEHVMHLLSSEIDTIKEEGEASISIGGRAFTIKKQFVDDLQNQELDKIIPDLNKALLVLHSPQDSVVEIDNAAHIYKQAKHPKSFVTLNGADHMLTNKDDAYYTGNVISSWVKRYIDLPEKEKLSTEQQVVVKLGDEGYTTEILAGKHGIIADESEALGGNDFGPSPYELLNSALGACTAMTLQMYARRKKWDLQEVQVHLSFNRSYKEDCEACSSEERRIEKVQKVIELKGDLTTEQKERLLEIAEKCPVHRTIAGSLKFETTLK